MAFIIGVDPGLTGAMAVLEDGRVTVVSDIPSYEVSVGTSGSAGAVRKKRRRLDIIGLTNWARSYHGKADAVWIENVSAMPGMHVVSMFNFGRVLGSIEACFVAARIPIYWVRPNVWKKSLGVAADKDAARLRASELLPTGYEFWQRKKDHNRAEAALIAFYGAQNGSET